MRRLETARRDFGKHWCEEQRIRFTNERETNRRIGTEFFLEIDRRRHPRETAAENDDARSYLRDFWRGSDWRCAKQTLRQTHCSSREQAEDEPEKKPADQCWKKAAHSFGGPLRRLSGKEGKQDDVDRAPHWQTESGGRHRAIRGCTLAPDRARQRERVSRSQDCAD